MEGDEEEGTDTKWTVPPTSGPQPRSSELVTTSGWYVEPKPFVSSWLTSLSLGLSASLSLVHLSPPPIIHGPREPWTLRGPFPLLVLADSPRRRFIPCGSHEYSSHDLLARVSKQRTIVLPRSLLSSILLVVSRCRNLSRFRIANLDSRA